jgi:pSer/pThr/pTyr-binding forkhead associated (FHA) protein
MYSPAMPMGAARLEVVAGKAAGTSIMVEDELVIGRHATGAGRLADDEEISRTHARITLERSGYLAIEDLGSTNGTFVNGLRISGPKTLTEGDGIEVGGTTLVVRELPLPTATVATTAAPRPPSPETVGSRRSHDDPGQAPGAPAAAADTPLPPLALQVEIDLAAREARILLDGSSEPVRVRHIDGSWRVVGRQR